MHRNLERSSRVMNYLRANSSRSKKLGRGLLYLVYSNDMHRSLEEIQLGIDSHAKAHALAY